jgi:hypothetical protein
MLGVCYPKGYGEVMSFGCGGDGQLGYGDVGDHDEFCFVDVQGRPRVMIAINGGGSHSVSITRMSAIHNTTQTERECVCVSTLSDSVDQ